MTGTNVPTALHRILLCQRRGTSSAARQVLLYGQLGRKVGSPDMQRHVSEEKIESDLEFT
jgi:hypothetical protein